MITRVDNETVLVRAPRSVRPIRGQVVAALAATAAIAGCGSSSARPSTTSTVAAQTTAGRHHSADPAQHASSKHARKDGHTGRSTSSQKRSGTAAHGTVRAKASTRPPVQAKQPAISAGAVTRSLSGTGNQSIGTLSEKSTVVLEWSTTSPPIQIFNTHGFMLVNSSSATGRIRLTRGDYTGLRVAAKGHWTIEVRAA